MSHVLWSAVTRDDVVLAEASDTGLDTPRLDAVKKLAKALLAKRPTPGWEFASATALRAVKFHVHEGGHVWSYACVADASLESMLAKGFLEKLALMTEPCREEPAWRTGATLSQQRAFGPTLQQRMDQANSQGRVALVSAQCDEVKGMMRDNIELLLARGDKLDELEEKAGALATISKQFHKGARHAKRAALWSNAKFGLAVGTAVTVGVAVIATPAIVAAAV